MGNVVAFTGSGNETIRGVTKGNNYERYVLNWSERSDYSSYGKDYDTLVEAIDTEIILMQKFSDLMNYQIIYEKYEITDNLDNIKIDLDYKFNFLIMICYLLMGRKIINGKHLTDGEIIMNLDYLNMQQEHIRLQLG